MDPVCPSNTQIAEIKNLRKKFDFLKSQLDEDDDDAEHTPDSDSDANESSEEEKPIKKKAGPR